LSVDFSDPERRTLLAGSHEGKELLRSTDGGATWVDVAPPLGEGVFASQPLVVSSQVFLLGASDGPGADDAAILRSTDGGSTWTTVYDAGVAGPPLFASDRSIYYLLQDGGMVRSTDEGATWSKVTRSHSLSSYTVVELEGGRLASLTERYAVISTDQGRSWRAVGPPLPAPTSWGVAYSAPRDALYVYGWDCESTVPAGAVQRLDLTPAGLPADLPVDLPADLPAAP
jgi:photosystem II stability/assembly factor-like uncharacterized protein